MSTPPKPPSQAISAGFTWTRFLDHFDTDQIDRQDTCAPGFNWYVHTAWPNQAGTPQSAITRVQNLPSTPSSYLTISNSILTISSEVTGNQGNGILTACQNATSGYVGNVFGGGAYIEIYAAWDPNGNESEFHPTFWMFSIENLIGNNTTGIEMDILESFNPGTGTKISLRQWDYVANPATYGSNIQQNIIASPGDTNYHKYGLLWKISSQGGGTGTFKMYVDDVLSSTMNYTGGGSTYSLSDTSHFPIILGTGAGWPVNIDYVVVWQSIPTFKITI